MTRKLFAVPVVASLLFLAGCAGTPALDSVAKECGGADAGIVIDDDDGYDALTYTQSDDATDKAWICLLQEFVPDKTDRYTITQGLDGGPVRDMTIGDLKMVYVVNDGTGIRMIFWI